LNKRWILPGPVPAEVVAQLEAYSPVERAVLSRRGVGTRAEAMAFFHGSPATHDPFVLRDMDRAVARIRSALQSHEAITVYGDYDADGLTGTALLVSYLRRLGGHVTHFIPNRYREGYGLTNEALQGLAVQGARLVITVDCGARSVDEADAARQAGLDLVITDHHAPGALLPACLALVNPKQPDDDYPFDDLSGAGLAYKLTQALASSLRGPDPDENLDLVAIGTIADLVPLYGENRTLTRLGLARLGTTARPGLRALMAVSGIQPANVRASAVGFGIAPRLNAAGRLDSAEAAYSLLMTESVADADQLALALDKSNRERRQVTGELVDLARALTADAGDHHLLFVAHPDFREGLAGVVASRLVEERFQPVVIAHLGDAEVRASARSIPGFHITHALDECADLLVRYGGHAAAAGFTVATDNLGQLAERLQVIARRELGEAELSPAVDIDALVMPADLGWRLVEFCESLEPCGFGNEAPVFAARGMRVRSARGVGAENKHLKLTLGVDGGGGVWDAIGFGLGSQAAGLAGRVDAAFRVERNTWGGYDSLQLNLLDVRPESP
jgi:single-stranded-DNA-specific exonuclease